MKPIQEQTHVEKAMLLHQLLPGEIRGYLAGLYQFAEQTIKDISEKKVATLPVATSAVDWLQFAQQSKQVIDTDINKLCTSPEFFAQTFFTGDIELFAIDYLQKHAAITGYRFRDGVKFLFDLKPFGKLAFPGDED